MVAVLTAGRDKPYALGLAAALQEQNVTFDFIGSDDVDSPDLRDSSLVNFFNLRGDSQGNVSFGQKVSRILAYYGRLLRYALTARPRVFHILWNNKFEYFDRTLLMLLYKMLGKRVIFTAHNVNAGKRDGNDSWLNRLSLRTQYRLADHIFIHTAQMQAELEREYGVKPGRSTVIPFGVNNTTPETALTRAEARCRLGLKPEQKVLLFFGNIAPYKGLEYLVDAFGRLDDPAGQYRLLIAGRVKDCRPYWQQIEQTIAQAGSGPRIIARPEFIPDEETEVYFKAADVLILPYTEIFQSGVLFLGYNFGLPVIAADVGSLREDITVGTTGHVCRPRDPGDLAHSIADYFSSDLYRNLSSRRAEVKRFAAERYSWSKVGAMTREVYEALQRAS